MSGSSDLADETPAGRIATLVIDCADMDRSSAFWGPLLGVQEVGRLDEYLFLEEIAPGLRLTLQQVADRKIAKSRVHFDIEPRDYDGFVEMAEALGATRVEYVEKPGYALLVMADPDGNEFCVDRHLAAMSEFADHRPGNRV